MKKKTIIPKNQIFRQLCEVCLSKKIKKIFFRKKLKSLNCNNYLFKFNNYYCQKCNFVFSLNVPNNCFLKKYYKEYPENFESPSIKELNLRLSYIKNLKNKNLLFIGENKKLFSFHLKKNKNNITFGNIENINKLNKKFDVIFCYMVLEHVNNINSFIKKISKISNDNCQLYIEVPDSEKYFKASFEGEHLNHFNAKNLKFFLEENYGKTLKLKKTRYYGIHFLSFFKKRKKVFKYNLTKNYIALLKKNNSKINFYTSNFVKKIKKYKKIGMAPANQDTLDLIQMCNYKKKISVFDKNFNSERYKKGFFNYKVKNYYDKSNLFNLDIFIVSSNFYKKSICKILNKSINKKKIIFNPII